MAKREHLDWFRGRLSRSLAVELKDPAPLLTWLDERRRSIVFHAELVGLDSVRDWKRDENGSIWHKSGQFFAVEGVRVKSGGLREVTSWDQPIYTQPEGGILGMVAREISDFGVQFLLQAKAEPGNIGTLQFCPSVQCTWSNIKQAHQGKRPPMVEVLTAKSGVRTVYQAQHNEEGGRFWQKSNENIVVFLDDDSVVTTPLEMFFWASFSQIKEIALMDNLLSPFVKTILAPL